MVTLDIVVVPALAMITSTIAELNTFAFPPSFDIRKVLSLAQSLPSHSWEFGAGAEALLELHNPELSVFGPKPFPVPASNNTQIRALSYAKSNIVLGTGYNALYSREGAAGDPASLGVSAVMLGKTESIYANAANQTVEGLLQDVPRFSNGAISHRVNVPELWCVISFRIDLHVIF